MKMKRGYVMNEDLQSMFHVECTGDAGCCHFKRNRVV
jgi:hypothetical protein